MSNTSEALKNVRILRWRGVAGAPDHSRLRTWLVKAAECLPDDIVLPPHIVPCRSGDDYLTLECKARGCCHDLYRVDTVAQAADFRDRHFYCGQSHAPAWRCPTCDHWAFAFEDRCRFCHREHDVAVAHAEMPYHELLDQYVSYDIFLPGRLWRATIKCNSLLRAKRAARATYRGQYAEVRTDFGSWDAEGKP